MGVVGDADYILLVDRKRSLQLAGDGAEAVEYKVLTHAVDPLTAGRQSAAHKVSTFPLTRAETPHDLHSQNHKCIQAHTKGQAGAVS